MLAFHSDFERKLFSFATAPTHKQQPVELNSTTRQTTPVNNTRKTPLRRSGFPLGLRAEDERRRVQLEREAARDVSRGIDVHTTIITTIIIPYRVQTEREAARDVPGDVALSPALL